MQRKKLMVVLTLVFLLSACGDPTATAPSPTATTKAVATIVSTTAQVGGTTATTGITVTIAPNTSAPVATPTAGQTSLTTSPATFTKANGELVKITVELARTPQEQQVGLMGRQSLPSDTGMLFIFTQTGKHSFWMRNTPLPLSIAFIAANGKIVDIKDMKPFSEELTTPAADHLYALEVPQGYFASKGIKIGDIFSLG